MAAEVPSAKSLGWSMIMVEQASVQAGRPHGRSLLKYKKTPNIKLFAKAWNSSGFGRAGAAPFGLAPGVVPRPKFFAYCESAITMIFRREKVEHDLTRSESTLLVSDQDVRLTIATATYEEGSVIQVRRGALCSCSMFSHSPLMFMGSSASRW